LQESLVTAQNECSYLKLQLFRQHQSKTFNQAMVNDNALDAESTDGIHLQDKNDSNEPVKTSSSSKPGTVQQIDISKNDSLTYPLMTSSSIKANSSANTKPIANTSVDADAALISSKVHGAGHSATAYTSAYFPLTSSANLSVQSSPIASFITPSKSADTTGQALVQSTKPSLLSVTSYMNAGINPNNNNVRNVNATGMGSSPSSISSIHVDRVDQAIRSAKATAKTLGISVEDEDRIILENTFMEEDAFTANQSQLQPHIELPLPLQQLQKLDHLQQHEQQQLHQTRVDAVQFIALPSRDTEPALRQDELHHNSSIVNEKFITDTLFVDARAHYSNSMSSTSVIAPSKSPNVEADNNATSVPSIAGDIAAVSKSLAESMMAQAFEFM
jgi:hypothetical protein